MAKITREKRDEIARVRILRILDRHGIANARTLEQKISDAGPSSQRVDPHILTTIRNQLVTEKRLQKIQHAGTTWYHRTDASPRFVERRLLEQAEIVTALSQSALSKRIGQSLEIATYKALCQLNDAAFFGRFRDLDAHRDDQLYAKEEPPQHIGVRSLPGKERLDFIIQHPDAGFLGIECKNVREWLYPDRSELIAALSKCLALDCIPVLIGRRIPYVTFRLFNSCGIIIHQTFNQLFPTSAQDIADRAKHKDLLGYHDIRTGNTPDNRLTTFITQNMMAVAPNARKRFAEYRDLVEAFVFKDMTYQEFAARVRRRDLGQNEDHDWPSDPADWYE